MNYLLLLRFHFMAGLIARIALLILLTSTGVVEAQQTKEAAAREAVSQAVLSALDRRYACAYVTGVRTEPLDVSDAETVHVVLDGFGELPGTHATAKLPTNWSVRLHHVNGRWRMDHIAIAEAELADALIAARTGAERDALLAVHERSDHAELARQLSDKGFAIDVTGDYARAEAIAELARTIAGDGGGDDAMARAIWLRGRARDGQDRIDEALADYLEAKRLADRSGDLETVAASLVGIGTMTMIKGGDEDGAAAIRSALADALAIGNDHIAATALLVLGNRQKAAGDFVAALRLYDDAATRAEGCGDLLIDAAAIANSGLVYDQLDNYDLASHDLRRAIALYRKAGSVRGVLRNLRNLAEIQTESFDLPHAEVTLTDIDRLIRRHFDARVAAYCDVTRARIALWRHRAGSASQLADRALRASRTIGDDKLTESAAETLGNALAARHHYAEALAQYDEALRLAKFSNDHDEYWRVRSGQADTLRRMGRTDQAKVAARDAIEVAEGIDATMPRGSLDQRSFSHDTRALYREMFRLAAGSDPSEALAWEERGRSRTLLAFLARGRTVPDSELTAGERDAQSATERSLREANRHLLHARLQLAREPAKMAALTASVKRARVERDAVTSRLDRNHPGPPWARGDVLRPSVEELRRSIPADGAILEYVLDQDRCWIVAVTRDHRPRIVAIRGDEAAIDRRVARFVALLSGAQPAMSSLSRELYGLLVKPVASELRGKTTICLVPDGSLWRLPFQALLAADGRYMIERHPLFYAPSATVLAWYESHRPDSARRPVLAIGNPDPGETATLAGPAHRDPALRPLPAAEREARIVASIHGGASQVLSGKEATEARFKSLAPQFRILHLATHGTFDDLQPMYSNVVLAPGGSEDGLFEAREWIGLGIRADLVVLAGCETGRGQAIGGEGVVGMSWSLLAAGCPTAVVTQTDVPERAAAALMIAFHRELAHRSKRSGAFDPGVATSALREAQLTALRDKRYAAPFHWAGFMIIGRGW